MDVHPLLVVAGFGGCPRFGDRGIEREADAVWSFDGRTVARLFRPVAQRRVALKKLAHHAVLYDYVLSRIPADASRILDAGCGDGAIVDRPPRRECTVGIDFSLEALRRD